MSTQKISILVIYAVLAVVALMAAGSTAGTWALNILLILAVAHIVEMGVFYKRCKQAGGSLAVHLCNVFLFGIFHIKEIEKTALVQSS